MIELDDSAKAKEYWIRCTNTYLAAPEYYQKQEDALQLFLAKISPCENALDIGCGDGHFTSILGEKAKSVLGIDISPNLVRIACARPSAVKKANVSFRVQAIEGLIEHQEYQLVSCMGVTSGLIDEKQFERAVQNIRRSMPDGARLILKDTLSLDEPARITVGDYLAVYRNINYYRRAFIESDFQFDDEIELIRTDNNTVNRMFLLTRI